jgi:hypothetical protein
VLERLPFWMARLQVAGDVRPQPQSSATMRMGDAGRAAVGAGCQASKEIVIDNLNR